jgi:nucleotide-binding universal stress UspA family protein
MRLFRFGKRQEVKQASQLPRHLLVPFANTPADREVLRFACGMAQAFRAKLTVLYVLELSRSVALEDPQAPGRLEGQKILSAAEEIGQETELAEFETLLKPAHHVGHAIVRVAQETEADMLLIEARHQRRLGMQTLDDTVETVLKKAPCYVWLHRSPTEEKK